MMAYTIYSIIFGSAFSFWFSLVREPGEIMSFWNKLASKQKETLKKILTCGFCHSGYISIIFILHGADIITLPLTMITYKLLNKLFYG